MTKKRFSILLVSIMCFTMFLTACSSKSSSGASTTAPTSASGTEAPVTDKSTSTPAEKASIRFSTWYGPGDIEVWKQVIAKFEAANPNITVAFEPLDWGNYWTKLQTELAAKSAPDVIGMGLGLIYNYTDKKQLESLDSYLNQTPGEVNGIPQSLLDNGRSIVAPAQYALPWRFVGGPLFVNLTAFKAAGVAYPENGWTTDEFLAAAKKLTTAKQFGFLAPVWSMSASLMSTFGAAPVSADKAHSTFNSPGMLSFMQWEHDLIFKDKVSAMPKDLDSKTDAFASGKVAMAFSGSWNIPEYRKITAFEWDVAPIPTKDGVGKTYEGPDMISITKDSKNKDAAWKFVHYVIFDSGAQDLLSTTGLPVLKKDLSDETKIAAVASQKPAHYKTFLEGASNSGVGYTYTAQDTEIQKLQTDAEFKILNDPKADVQKEVTDLHNKVEQALTKK
jgi:multiple sugar transport system substrate-binding protein